MYTVGTCEKSPKIGLPLFRRAANSRQARRPSSVRGRLSAAMAAGAASLAAAFSAELGGLQLVVGAEHLGMLKP